MVSKSVDKKKRRTHNIMETKWKTEQIARSFFDAHMTGANAYKYLRLSNFTVSSSFSDSCCMSARSTYRRSFTLPIVFLPCYLRSYPKCISSNWLDYVLPNRIILSSIIFGCWLCNIKDNSSVNSTWHNSIPRFGWREMVLLLEMQANKTKTANNNRFNSARKFTTSFYLIVEQRIFFHHFHCIEVTQILLSRVHTSMSILQCWRYMCTISHTIFFLRKK